MKSEHFQKFLEKQRKKIDEDKWNEGVRICHDPGQEFVSDWIKKNAKRFRKDFTLEELQVAYQEMEEMLMDLKNQVVDINKLIKYVQDMREKLELAQETLAEKEENGEK
jgi:hypothetical protein